MELKRFDVFWVDLNPTVGSEINKIRPCVIISPDELIPHKRSVIVIPITSSIKKLKFRPFVTVNNKEGQVVVDQIRTIDKKRLKGFIQYLDMNEKKQLTNTLTEFFAF
jgi:mRNA interferase MazF